MKFPFGIYICTFLRERKTAQCHIIWMFHSFHNQIFFIKLFIKLMRAHLNWDAASSSMLFYILVKLIFCKIN